MEFLFYKIRDLKNNTLLSIYQNLEDETYFLLKNSIKDFISDYVQRELTTYKMDKNLFNNFKNWGNLNGEIIRMNSKFLLIDSNLINIMMMKPTSKYLSHGITYIIENS